MTKEIRATNAQIRDFYFGKEPHPPVTDAYMKTKFGQRSGGYISFAKDCNAKDHHNSNLQQLENYRAIAELEFLKKVKQISILDVDLSSEFEPNQKWHLYVSLFAQSIIENNGFSWDRNFRKYPCLQLKLWMAETAGIDVSHIGQAIAENREKREINQMIKQLSWNDVFQIVCEAKSDCKNYHK